MKESTDNNNKVDDKVDIEYNSEKFEKNLRTIEKKQNTIKQNNLITHIDKQVEEINIIKSEKIFSLFYSFLNTIKKTLNKKEPYFDLFNQTHLEIESILKDKQSINPKKDNGRSENSELNYYPRIIKSLCDLLFQILEVNQKQSKIVDTCLSLIEEIIIKSLLEHQLDSLVYLSEKICSLIFCLSSIHYDDDKIVFKLLNICLELTKRKRLLNIFSYKLIELIRVCLNINVITKKQKTSNLAKIVTYKIVDEIVLNQGLTKKIEDIEISLREKDGGKDGKEGKDGLKENDDLIDFREASESFSKEVDQYCFTKEASSDQEHHFADLNGFICSYLRITVDIIEGFTKKNIELSHLNQNEFNTKKLLQECFNNNTSSFMNERGFYSNKYGFCFFCRKPAIDFSKNDLPICSKECGFKEDENRYSMFLKPKLTTAYDKQTEEDIIHLVKILSNLSIIEIKSKYETLHIKFRCISLDILIKIFTAITTDPQIGKFVENSLYFNTSLNQSIISQTKYDFSDTAKHFIQNSLDNPLLLNSYNEILNSNSNILISKNEIFYFYKTRTYFRGDELIPIIKEHTLEALIKNNL